LFRASVSSVPRNRAIETAASAARAGSAVCDRTAPGRGLTAPLRGC
jgi:hypothetical protein